MKNKRRWVPFVITTLLASGCGIVLGMLLLSIFTGQEVVGNHNRVLDQELPKVVQASSVSARSDLVNDLVNQKTLVEKEIFFPIMEWSFIQAGAFKDRNYAEPIINQLESHGIRPQMIDRDPARVMVAGFLASHKANAVSKKLSDTGIELYNRALHMMYEPITLQLPETEASFYDVQLNNELLAYVDLAQSTSYAWITGTGEYTSTLTLVKNIQELRSTVEQIQSYGTNSQIELLEFLSTELTNLEQTITRSGNHNRQLGWAIQEHVLTLLSQCKVI